MISALGMELDMVRVVFKGALNEVGVYIDAKRDTGTYYTVVSIFSKPLAKLIAERIAVDGLFGQNGDFIGSFTHKDALHLVFVYRDESRLAYREALYAATFAKRKEVALNFLAALAETEIRGDVGMLLISDENVNLMPDGKIYLNYCFDFTKFSPNTTQDDFHSKAGSYVFDVLTREYAAKYEQQVEMYPHELRLMFKKIQNRAFRSLSQIMMFIKALPDKPAEQKFGIARLLGAFGRMKAFLSKNPSSLFLVSLVIVTAIYLGYQIVIRVMADRNTRENTVYVGMRQIGEVYLGEENV